MWTVCSWRSRPELNLLASVGNTYSLHRLQQAAIIQDRGHRKPWENGAKGKKAYQAHVTDHNLGGDDAIQDGDADNDNEVIPEEVAMAFMTYQSARDKYREQIKSRGYGHDSGERDKGRNDKEREERAKAMKARSFCAGCGRKRHWHNYSACPKNRGNANPPKPARSECATTCLRKLLL